MEDAFAFAARAFRPLYYTRQYAEDAAKIEMSFDLTHYQAQFRGEGPAGPVAREQWRTWADVAHLFDGSQPQDPDWDTERDLVDQSLRDPFDR